MKQRLASLFGVGILALMVASPPNAFGATCGTMAGRSYAILITGAHYFNGTEPAGAAPVPTPIVGMGVIQVSPSCTIGGELLYNDNDTITGPGSCTPGGSNVAFGGLSGYVTPTAVAYSGSVPCFTGTNTQLSGSVSLNAASLGTLTVTDSVTGSTFNFSIANALGSISWSGTSVPTNTGSGTVPPILTIQGQRQGVVPVATTYGQSPWKGQWQFTCNTQTTSDSGNDPGSFQSNVGATSLPAGNTVGGGLFNLNLNNAFWLESAVSFPNAPCYFSFTPDASGGGPFPDGTANVVLPINGPYSGTCQSANFGEATAGSQILWGTTDGNLWYMGTASSFPSSGFTWVSPLGSGGVCTSTAALVGKLYGPATIHTGGTSRTPLTVKLLYFNSTAMDCLTYFTLSGGSGDCVFAATGTNTQTEDMTPGFSSNTAVELTCTGSDAEATLTASWGGAFPGIPGGPQCAFASNPVTLQ